MFFARLECELSEVQVRVQVMIYLLGWFMYL
jgi:hypothetical protein